MHFSKQVWVSLQQKEQPNLGFKEPLSWDGSIHTQLEQKRKILSSALKPGS